MSFNKLFDWLKPSLFHTKVRSLSDITLWFVLGREVSLDEKIVLGTSEGQIDCEHQKPPISVNPCSPPYDGTSIHLPIHLFSIDAFYRTFFYTHIKIQHVYVLLSLNVTASVQHKRLTDSTYY